MPDDKDKDQPEEKELATLVDEGFEKLEQSQEEKLKEQEDRLKTYTQDELKALREEVEQGRKAAQAEKAQVMDLSFAKRQEAFKKEGKFFAGDKWVDFNDFFRAIAYAEKKVTGNPRFKNGYTLEEFDNWQTERKALSEGTTTAGGYLVPDEFNEGILEQLVNPNEISAYVQRIVTSRDNLLVNTEDTEPAGAWIGEASGIETSTTDPVFGQSTISVFDWKAGYKVSNNLLADSATNIGQYLAAKMAKTFLYAVQKYIISGTGSSQPYGITAATPGTTTNYGTLAWSNIMGAYFGITKPYRPTAVWGVPSAMMTTLLNLEDTSGQRIFGNINEQKPPFMCLGRPIIEDSNWDANDIDFVDMDGYIMADRSQTEVFITPHPYADNNQTYFRFIRRWGGQYLRTNGYYKLNKT